MGFPDLLLVAGLVTTVAVVLYSWKEPVFLIPVFVLLLGGVFAQVDLNERLYVQVTTGVRLYLRDFIIILMIIHVLRAHNSLKKSGLVFYKPITFFLAFLVINLGLKFLFYGPEFDDKITPFIRLFATFAIYFLLIHYLNVENFRRFANSINLLALISLLVFFGYALGPLPMPSGLTALNIYISSDATAVRLPLPNTFFLFFPYFLSIAPLIGESGRMRFRDAVLATGMIAASFVSLYRMYLSVVVFGFLLALVVRRGRLVKRFAIAVSLCVALFAAVQVLVEARDAGVVRAAVERFAGTGAELQDEGGSAGGRVVRTYAAIGSLSDPATFLIGTAFTNQFREYSQLFGMDLGIIASFIYYGIPGMIFIIVLYKRGLTSSAASLRTGEPLGRVSGATFLFFIAMLPAVLFMYNPLEHEMMIAVWACVLGTFDAFHKSAQSTSRTV